MKQVFLFSETIAVPTFDLLTLQCANSVEDIMSLDHAKKVIAEKLQADAGFRDRVANFILYQGVVSNLEDLKNIRKELQTQIPADNGYCYKIDGYCASIANQNKSGHKCSFEESPHGYEYWVG